MKRISKFILIIFILGLLASSTVLAGTNPVDINGTEMISSMTATDDGLAFSLHVPWDTLAIDEVLVGGQVYASLSLPGWENSMAPGSPALPFWSTAVGVPFGAEVSITVQPGKHRTVKLESIPLPAEGLSLREDLPIDAGGSLSMIQPDSTIEPDPSIYNQTGLFPASLGEVTSDAVLRQQRVVGIHLYPIQYDPAHNRLVIYEQLDVTIVFSGQSSRDKSISKAESQTFESILEDLLLNYEQAKAWRDSPLKQREIDDVRTTTSPTPWTPPEPGWRISLSQEGIYEVTFSELLAAGVPVETLDPATLRLFNRGEEIAMDFHGDEDASFESGESILFYAQENQTKYSNQNIYWLTYGQSPGLRMAARDVTPASAPTPPSFINSLTMEENHYYTSSAPGDDDFERFMWGLVAANNSQPGQWSQPFEITAPLDGSGQIAIDLLGYIERAVNPDHHVRIYLENAVLPKQQIAELSWDGVAWQNPVIDLPAGYLVDGENTLTVESLNDTGGIYDRVYVDKIEIHYPGLFSAQANQFHFHYDLSGDWLFNVDGFSSVPQAIYDITDPSHVVKLVNFTTTGSSPYALQFQESLSAPSDYLVWGEEVIQTVNSIILDQPSQLASTGNRADYILITPESFSELAQTLVDHRQAQDLDAMLVDIQDIYDEFNYGLADTNAIHDFLQYAYENWTSPAPSYVVLLGDGHYDPNNYLGNDRASFVPPFLAVVDPWIKETASDNRYVTVSGEDTLPDMMIGRLSVNSPTEAEAVINKIIGYEASAEAGDWQESILAVADNPDSGGIFPAYSESVLNASVPESIQIEKVYYGVTHPTIGSARTAILNAINEGVLFVNYIGHAYYTGWAYEDLFTASDVPSLTNGVTLPVVLAMTCYEGYFQRPNPIGTNSEALAEVVTTAQGAGAIASFSPAGLGVATGHDVLNRGFFSAYFEEQAGTIGEAVLNAKFELWSTGANLDLLDTYLLFGDPATKFSRRDDSYRNYFPLIIYQGLN